MAQAENKKKPAPYVDTVMKKDKETKNAVVYTSRALSALYVPKLHFPETETEFPAEIHVVIEKA